MLDSEPLPALPEPLPALPEPLPALPEPLPALPEPLLALRACHIPAKYVLHSDMSSWNVFMMIEYRFFTLFARLLTPFLIGSRRSRTSGLERGCFFAFSDNSLILNDFG